MIYKDKYTIYEVDGTVYGERGIYHFCLVGHKGRTNRTAVKEVKEMDGKLLGVYHVWSSSIPSLDMVIGERVEKIF